MKEPPKIIGRLILLSVFGLLLLVVAGKAVAAQRTNKCGADEIHWTIDERNVVSFDWSGTAPAVRYGLTPTYDHSARGRAPSPIPISSTDHSARRC